MDIYTIASVLHGTTVINGLTSSRFSAGLAEMLLAGSGQVDPTFAAVGRAQPSLEFTTVEIKNALANLGGIAGIAIADSNFSYWYQKTVNGALRAGATSHLKGTVVSGYLVPSTLTASGGEGGSITPASIAYRAHFLSADGDAAPQTIAASQSLDAGQAGASQAYVLGDVAINGSTIDGNMSVTLEFGINVEVTGGRLYPTNAFCLSRRPRIRISTRQVDLLPTFSAIGIAQSATDSSIELDDITNGAARGTTPITITIDGGRIAYEEINGSDGQVLEGSLVITPVYDGTADILVLGGLT